MNETFQLLKPRILALDPNATDMTLLMEELKTLEQDSQNIYRQVRFLVEYIQCDSFEIETLKIALFSIMYIFAIIFFQTNYSLENSDSLVEEAKNLRNETTYVSEKVYDAIDAMEDIINDIAQLASSLSTGEGWNTVEI